MSLPLETHPRCFVLFGLAGSGKSYAARVLSEELGFIHLEGDHFLTAEMLKAISSKQVFTQSMIDEFTLRLVEELKQVLRSLPPGHPGVLLSQALYRRKNREMIRQAGLGVCLIEVQSDDETVLSRVSNREGQVDTQYVQMIRRTFEACTADEGVSQILNLKGTTRASIVEQFLEII